MLVVTGIFVEMFAVATTALLFDAVPNFCPILENLTDKSAWWPLSSELVHGVWLLSFFEHQAGGTIRHSQAASHFYQAFFRQSLGHDCAQSSMISHDEFGPPEPRN